MPAMTTLVTPAENRFFLLSERVRRQSSLQQISPLLREHVTIKADSDFLKPTVRNLIIQKHADWLTACSHEWQLLASLPYVINPSESRTQWRHCELCHKPVRYEYHVQNKHNHQELVVGSECVKKFMNAETRYLMVITTEDNRNAVQQYQTLTEAVPVVPTIMFKQPWLPDLPVSQRPQAQQLRQTTTDTVTTYLRRRTTKLPLRELRPAEQTYQRLAADEQAVVAAEKHAAQQRLVQDQQQRQIDAQQSVNAAEQKLRNSRAYRRYLSQLAAIIVTRPERPEAKQRFEKLTVPAMSKTLVNSYQFGQMVIEYRQTGRIQVRRLAMLDHQFVQDLDQTTRELDQRQTTRFYDDVFNSCWGWTYHQAANQRADWQRLLTTRWASQLTLTWFEQLCDQSTVTQIETWLGAHATETMQRELGRRLAANPELGVIARQRLTKGELQTFCRRELATSETMADFNQRFDQQYHLAMERQAELHETLSYFYVAQHSETDHQTAIRRFQWLLEHR
ncbi:hypothetical protein [Lactiplantibacillus xiangfangensis]|nr:hypothetical protein [Lactiplantibacillus xiangfangensis]